MLGMPRQSLTAQAMELLKNDNGLSHGNTPLCLSFSSFSFCLPTSSGRCRGPVKTWDMAGRTVYACTACQVLVGPPAASRAGKMGEAKTHVKFQSAWKTQTTQ